MLLKKVKIKFNPQKIESIESTVEQEVKYALSGIKKGAKIAIACGSRGISNIEKIVKKTVDTVKDLECNPFIIPAMGSHGTATAEGQIEVLSSLKITEENMGCKIISSMDTIKLERMNAPVDVYFSKDAYESDGVIIINRIKAHTDFHGDYESGIAKMSVLGLGKHDGALAIHQYGHKGLKDFMPKVAKRIFDTKKILMGLAIVENAYDETLKIKGLKANEILKEEPALLKLSKQNMPKLPVKDIDILLIKYLGKNISGTGLDPNIIGRIKIPNVEEPSFPNVDRIVIEDITEESHGNSVGVGFSDMITKKLYEKIDMKAMFENIVTATFLERGKIPLVADTTKKAFKAIVRSLGRGKISHDELRVIYIKDTLHLSEIYISQKIYEEIKNDVESLTDYQEIFNNEEDLINI